MINNFDVTLEELYNKTDQGLDIIKHCLPGVNINGKSNFKARPEERTASANVFLSKNGYYMFNDFGDNMKAFSPWDMLVNKGYIDTTKDYNSQLKEAYSLFNIPINNGGSFSFDNYTVIEENTDKDIKYFKVKTTELKEEDLKRISTFLTVETCKKYDFFAVEYFDAVSYNEATKTKTLYRISSTNTNKIFCYSDDLTKWAKIYQPQTTNKNFKHRYLGEKPYRYVYGLKYINSVITKEKRTRIEDIKKEIQELKNKPKNKDSESIIHELEEELKKLLLKRVVICSGGSDGLTFASLYPDYFILWTNSEAEEISEKEFEYIKSICSENEIYNLPDIDASGVIYAKKLMNSYPDIKTLWISKSALNIHSKEYSDFIERRGKDFRDYVKQYANKKTEEVVKIINKELFTEANKYNFFEEKIVESTGRKKVTVSINRLLDFLSLNGYYTYKEFANDRSETEQKKTVIKIDGYIIYKNITVAEIKRFCMKNAPVKYGEIGNNAIINSKEITEQNLLLLGEAKIDINHGDKDSQYFFFNNTAVKITANSIQKIEEREHKKYVFENKIIKRKIDLINTDFFEIYRDKNENLRINIKEKNCDVLNFYINLSRIHWKEERKRSKMNVKEWEEKGRFEEHFTLNSKYLIEKEQIEQENILISLLFSVGYLLHDFKRADFARMVYITDGAEKETNTEANGGTGKSLFGKLLSNMVNIYQEDAKSNGMSNDNHFLGSINEGHKLININDGKTTFNLSRLYNIITDDLVVNPKGKNSFSIPFERSPKVMGTFNHMIKTLAGSDTRRLYFLPVSDYYHDQIEGEIRRQPMQDFNGYAFFSQGWPEEQKNKFFNLIIQAVKFHLKYINDMIQNPSSYKFGGMDLIPKTNILIASITENFISWADEYFIGGENFNRKIITDSAWKEYLEAVNKKAISRSQFSPSLKKYCELKGFEYNPKEQQDKDGRIRVRITGITNTFTAFYIKREEPQDQTLF